MIDANIWPFPFQCQTYQDIVPKMVKARKMRNDVVYLLYISDRIEIVIYAISRHAECWDTSTIEKTINFLEAKCDWVSRAHVIGVSQDESKGDFSKLNVQSKFPLRFYHDDLPSITKRFATCDTPSLTTNAGWPIIDRVCYQSAKQQLVLAQKTQRPLLIDGARGSGKSTVVGILSPGICPELTS